MVKILKEIKYKKNSKLGFFGEITRKPDFIKNIIKLELKSYKISTKSKSFPKKVQRN